MPPKIIPAALFIEEACDALQSKDAAVILAELKEMAEANPEQRLQCEPLFRLTDLQKGYQLGLETARALLEQMPAAVKAGVMI